MFVFLVNGGSVNAGRTHHDKENHPNPDVRPARYGGISGPFCLSVLLRVADVSRRSELPCSGQIASKGAA